MLGTWLGSPWAFDGARVSDLSASDSLSSCLLKPFVYSAFLIIAGYREPVLSTPCCQPPMVPKHVKLLAASLHSKLSSSASLRRR